MFEGQTKKVLKEALNKKEENLILLHLDRFHQNRVVKRLFKIDEEDREKYQELDKELKKEKDLLGKEKSGNKDKKKILTIEKNIVDIESKAKLIKDRHTLFLSLKKEAEQYDNIIFEAKYLIDTMKECLKDPKILYEDK